MLRLGSIVDIFVAHITPPHRKFYVVCCFEPMVLGFFINSGINPYIQKRPRMLEAQVRVTKADHPFLDHDSWLDCTEVHTFTRTYLEREIRTNPEADCGDIAAAVEREMLGVIVRSHTLAGDHVSWITSAFRAEPEV